MAQDYIFHFLKIVLALADYIGIMRKEKQDPQKKECKMFKYPSPEGVDFDVQDVNLILNDTFNCPTFEEVNLILASMVDNKLIEPIDDPNEFIVQEDYSWVLGMNSGNEYYRADNGEF